MFKVLTTGQRPERSPPQLQLTGGMTSRLEVARQGERHSRARASRDWSRIFELPTVALSGPLEPTPKAIEDAGHSLYDYQRRSLARMLAIEADGNIRLPLGLPGTEVAHTFRGGVICDEVGMGKTAQLIALFLASPAPPGQPRNLVITPGHLCNQWSNEIQKFAPSLRVAVAADPSALGPNPRRVLEPACQANDVVITSLEVVLQIVQIREVLFGLSWRRIVYDECHEVIANTSLEQQGMLEQLARRARNVWAVSGTPFPHHDASMYGIHQLLGVKYKMHIVDSPFARNKPLAATHPFSMIKRRFYLKNTPASVGSEWEQIGGRFTFRVRTTRLDLTLTERGFYDEASRRVGTKSRNGYGPNFVPLRQLCDHPAACKDWAEALAQPPGGNVLTLEDLRNRFILQKERELEQMATNRARIREHKEAAECAKRVVQQLNSVLGNVTSADLAEVQWPDANPNYRLVQSNGAVALNRRQGIKMALLGHMRSYEARRHFLTLTHNWLETVEPQLARLASEEAAVQKELDYFRGVLKELRPEATAEDQPASTDSDSADGGQPAAPAAAAAATQRECIICADTEMKIVSMPPCGHYFCTSCLQKWLVDHTDCPTCRRPVEREGVLWINLELQASSAGSLLTRRFGTKPAALVQFIKAELEADPSSRFIVFSQWHSMLKLTANTLELNGLSSVLCDSKVDAENAAAIETFRTSDSVRVIMLSMEFAASGTNLQAANHVILLEPPGVNPAHGVAQETQAIGRAARLGQERVINVTRFVINDSIESDLFKQNEQQRMANERTRRFCCSESDEIPVAQASQPAAAAAGSTESIDIACSLMPPDPSCFELRGASAAPAQSSEPTLLSTSCPSEADVSKLRSLLLAAAAEHFPLSAGCTLSLFFAGRQLADNNSLASLKIERNCQLQGMLRNAKPARAENVESTDAAAANSPATRESAVIDLSQSEPVTRQGSEEPAVAAQSDQAEAAEEDLSTDEIDGLKVVELRAELKRRGCVSSGRRAALLARLKAKVAEPKPTQRTGRKRRRDETEELISPAASPVEHPDASPDNGQSNDREIPTGEPPEQQSQSDSAAQQSTQESRAADSPDSPSRDSPPRDARNRSGDESRQLLVGMGFEAARSEAALQAAEGNVERAAVLLAEGFTGPQQAHAVVPAAAGAAAGDSMERSRGPSTASASARAAQPAPKRPHSFDLTSPNEAGQDLAVLQDICHCDATVASRALSASGGDLQRAISTLLYRSSVL